MKTWNNLLKKSLTPECVAKCTLDAAKGKLARREVVNAFVYFDETYDLIYRCATNPDYYPRDDYVCKIRDGTRGKERTIEKPAFSPEQILHHVLMEPFKEVVCHGLYEEVYGCLPAMVKKTGDDKTVVRKYGPHAAIKRLAKWVQTGSKIYVAELDIHHAYNSVDLEILMKMLRRVITDEAWLSLLERFLTGRSGKKKGLVLGHYTSPWLWNFYLKEFDHYAASFDGIRYLRFADNLFIVGANKRKMHRAVEAIKSYLWENLRLKLNKSAQVYRLEYPAKDGKIRGRAVNALGAVIHYNRVTLRKSMLERMRRKAIRISKKERVTWYDGAAMLSRLAWIRKTNTHIYFEEHVKPLINIPALKRKVSAHSKAVTPIAKERRRRIYDGLENSKRFASRKAT